MVVVVVQGVPSQKQVRRATEQNDGPAGVPRRRPRQRGHRRRRAPHCPRRWRRRPRGALRRPPAAGGPARAAPLRAPRAPRTSPLRPAAPAHPDESTYLNIESRLLGSWPESATPGKMHTSAACIWQRIGNACACAGMHRTPARLSCAQQRSSLSQISILLYEEKSHSSTLMTEETLTAFLSKHSMQLERRIG